MIEIFYKQNNDNSLRHPKQLNVVFNTNINVNIYYDLKGLKFFINKITIILSVILDH